MCPVKQVEERDRVIIYTDDDIYRPDAVWLGPKNYQLPFKARYSAYGLGVVVMLAAVFVERHLGIPFGIPSLVLGLVVTVAVTTILHRRIDYDRPARCLWQTFRAELTAPREPKAETGSWCVPVPWRPWWRR